MRDVGAQLSWSFGKAVPVAITAGLFNGSGLTNQKDFWTDNINFSAKAQVDPSVASTSCSAPRRYAPTIST